MTPEKTAILCFPGFLGLPSDFKFIANITPEFDVVDVCGSQAPVEGQNWAEWENSLLLHLKDRYFNRKVAIIAYSMGARIALSLLSKNPAWINKAILISCHPGLSTNEEKRQRELLDLLWSKKFYEDDWVQLLQSWNSQESLASSLIKPLNENQFSRPALARAMEVFSLSKQEVLANGQVSIPTMVCWGQNDLKFKSLSQILKKNFVSAYCCEVPDAGHRVHFDNPAYLIDIIKSFVN